MCLKPNNGHVFTIICSIFNRGLNPNTLQVFKKCLVPSNYSVSDQDSLNPDPDPGILLNPDPDPGQGF